ncbi:MAG: hypothetical protein N2512_10995 [Armatimonadetes bacterium]|nr:hypothetical protein [Armatimonadota bacterium]
MSAKCVRIRSWLLAAILLMPATALARLPGEYYNEFHLGYVTPHTPWGKPLAAGKLRAFFIAPTHAAREVTELAQRLDIEVGGETAIDSSSLGDPGIYGPYPSMVEGTSPEEKKWAVLEKLEQPYDVYVLANFPLAKLPVQIQYEILRHVKEGAGLLLTYRREAPEPLWKHPMPEAAAVASEVPIAGLNFYRTTFLKERKLDDVAQAVGMVAQGFRLGKGRIVLIDYATQSPAGYAGGFCLTPHEPYTYRTLTEYDYHHSLVAKALLWAAGRTTAVTFSGLPPGGFRLTSDAEPTTVTVTTVNSSTQAVKGKLEVSVRNEWGEKEHSETLNLSLPPGEAPLPLRLSQLPGGTHFLDLRLVSPRGVEGWASAALLVSAPLGIEELDMAKTSFERGEACTGKARLSAPCPGGAWKLRVTLLDNYERRFATRDFAAPAGAQTIAFSLPLDASVSIAGRCRAMLLRDGLPLDQKEAEFFVRQGDRGQFPALVWGNLPGIFGRFCCDQLRKVGFNTILHYYGTGYGEGRAPEDIARQDFRAVPYVTRINWDNGRLANLETDPETEHLRRCAEMSRPYDPLVYSLGDENFIPAEGGYHPNERPAFVAFLRSRYADLSALNTAWGTNLASFEEAAPVTASEAAAAKQFARYHDTEAFREFLYANWHHYCHDVIKQVDPLGHIGAEGSVPGDLELTIQGLEFWGPYRDVLQNTLLRSLAPRSLLRGNWFGGYCWPRNDLPGLPRFLWESILDGSTLLEVYCSYTCENFYNTDLTWAYWMETFLPYVKELTDGLGQLLVASEHDCDPVAIYHSQPSLHFEALSAPFGGYEASHRAVLRMLEDASYVSYYVTSREVAAGRLRQKPPKVLLLPHIVALSDPEAAEIERFVRDGGVLISDVRPGVADGNCKPREAGALDALFGITRQAGEGLPKPVALGGAQVLADGAVAAAAEDATPLASAGDVPLAFRRQVGKGTAILLNFSFQDLPRAVAAGAESERLALPRLLADIAKVQPAWRVQEAEGKTMAGGRVAAFARGPARILGTLPPRPEDVKAPVKVTILAPAKRHLYDLRAGKYLGLTDRTAADLRFTPATFISALPYKVAAVKVSAPSPHSPGVPCPVRVALQATGGTRDARPVLRVRVFGPDGEERLYYARTLMPAGLKGETTIPFALNDAPGAWKIIARDVLTGIRGETTVRLVGKQ